MRGTKNGHFWGRPDAEAEVLRLAVEPHPRLAQEQVALGALDTPADLGDLAYVVMRIGESLLYSDVIIGAEPDVAKAGQMLRLLLGDHGR